MTDTTIPPSDDPPEGASGEPPSGGGEGILPVTIEDEVRESYLAYAMSVIVSRALPDVRDGLKPVHRRVLYTMNDLNVSSSRPHRKSALIIGDVMGKYHPHSNDAIYDAMARLAQDFSLRLMLLDGQGNFGSMDGDKPAAMRYTEIRMAKAGEAFLADIDKETVDFMPNYDNSIQEPVVLPTRIPNLLVNGASGIAVGMATNIPPHNLGEVLDACLALIENHEITVPELMEHVTAPDFPTGGIIMGTSGIRSAYETGRGSIVIRSRTHIEELRKDREAIIVTEVPYMVNKATMIEKIAEGVREKRIEGISELRDESDRHGVRVVIELKRDAVADVVLNQLYRFSQLQTSFGINMLALDGGRPQTLNLKRMIEAFVEFREEVVTRRTKFELLKARDRAHILVGLVIAVANIDMIIDLIRKAPDPATARAQLLEREWDAQDVQALVELIAEPGHEVVDGKYRLSDEQARGILELRLSRLTALGRDEIGDELEGLRVKIEDYLEILKSRERIVGIVREELEEVREAFADERRTSLEASADYDDEDLIQREEMVVTVTQAGYIKRVPLSTYRLQGRGGKGRSGMSTKDEDFVREVLVAGTHQPILFFSTTGMVYMLKVWRLPQGSPQSRGKAMVNLLPLDEGEAIATVMPLPEDESEWQDKFVMFSTGSGNVRRNSLADFTNVRANGKIAMKLGDGDYIVDVKPAREDQDVLLAHDGGKCIRFNVGDVRVFKGRDSTGVRGIKLPEGAKLVSMSILDHVDTDPAEARAYLKQAALMRRAVEGEAASEAVMATANGDDEGGEEVTLSPGRYAELGAREQFVMTLTVNGFGKRTSAYEFRVMGRGAQGVIAIDTSPERNGPLLAAFPVEEVDQLMLVTDMGQLIRCPVDKISVVGRNTQGVIVFRTADDEKVVSVAHLADPEQDEDENDRDESDQGDETDASSPEND